ncbi:MAG: type III secretion system cytoplasmic ring protein SctQ [Simkania sp.]|nr:type III secretion system cytoplasmic ring protein SctQ [Simkania sp.]
MSVAPEGWIKQIETSILQTKEIPMWGAFPGFPWKEFANVFAQNFNLKEFKMTVGTSEWKSGSSILTGMGRSPLQLSMELTPLQGSFSLIVPTEDFTKLSSWAIDPKAGEEGFSDPFLQKGFFRYITLEALHLVDQLQIFRGLTPKIVEMPLSKEDAYCVDIALEKDSETVWGRLVCPPLFHEAFREHYTGEWRLSIPSEKYEQIDLDLSMSAGRTTLSQDDWKNLYEGDLLFLDYCSYSPSLGRGTFQLMFDHLPLFQVKLKDENVKILDYALYYEESKMTDEHDEHMYEEAHRMPGDPSHPEEEMAAKHMGQNRSEEMISPKKVPIHLSVEVAHLKMNLDKLLKLKPGNTLELNVKPEQGVSLVANGKCMAKGNLVQIGDVIGVKITKIGQ